MRRHAECNDKKSSDCPENRDITLRAAKKMTHSEASGVLGDDEFLVAVLGPLSEAIRPDVGPPENEKQAVSQWV
jgi:hypothetical protein